MFPVLTVLVMIVRDRIASPSLLVRRRDADVAFSADLRAVWRGARGSSMLMVLFSMRDWTEYS